MPSWFFLVFPSYSFLNSFFCTFSIAEWICFLLGIWIFFSTLQIAAEIVKNLHFGIEIHQHWKAFVWKQIISPIGRLHTSSQSLPSLAFFHSHSRADPTMSLVPLSNIVCSACCCSKNMHLKKTSKSAGVYGVFWRVQETINLRAIWGEKTG